MKVNKSAYKHYGLKRGVWRSLSSKHFDSLPNSEVDFVSSNSSWNQNGFITLEGFYPNEFIDEINNEVDAGLKEGVIDFNYTQKKILFGYEKIEILKKVINDKRIKAKLEELCGNEVVPFQSINFLSGSEQKAHSDSVHMATYPLGGLIAIWVALEDVDEQNGTLFYYPGSHKMPYATNKRIGNKTGCVLSPNPNKNYEDYLEKELANSNLQLEIFNAKKGDVLIWHGNLVHGGLPHLDKQRTRKSMVVHYFMKDRICYHELSQRPAVVKEIV